MIQQLDNAPETSVQYWVNVQTSGSQSEVFTTFFWKFLVVCLFILPLLRILTTLNILNL